MVSVGPTQGWLNNRLFVQSRSGRRNSIRAPDDKALFHEPGEGLWSAIANSSQMSSIRVGLPMCVLNVQPTYAGSLAWQAFSACRLTRVARKNWSARLTVYSMPTAELTVGERGVLRPR